MADTFKLGKRYLLCLINVALNDELLFSIANHSPQSLKQIPFMPNHLRPTLFL